MATFVGLCSFMVWVYGFLGVVGWDLVVAVWLYGLWFGCWLVVLLVRGLSVSLVLFGLLEFCVGGFGIYWFVMFLCCV